MQVVVDSLRANPDVVVVGAFESNNLSSGEWPGSHWNRSLDIYTHPKDPLYTADELNRFMGGLVPELQPSCSDLFSGGTRGEDLAVGILYYDEVIGTAALSAAVELREDLSIVRQGLVVPAWLSQQTLDLRQRTWVRVFPDGGHLADAATGINKYKIPTSQLGKRGRGRIVTRLFQAPTLGGVVDADRRPEELEA